MAKRTFEARTKLAQRNNDVLEAMELGFTYAETAELLDITRDQVAESVKVLHDEKRLEYRHKRDESLILTCMPRVKELMESCKSKKEIADTLGISDQTVIRCIAKLNVKE